MISKTSEYALRAIVALAGERGAPRLAPDVAEVTGVPTAYLSKVLQTLVRAGLVHSQRGLGGGFTLARPASEITVLDVVDAVDPIQRIDRCPLDMEAHSKKLCPLHQRLDEAAATIQASFAGTTVFELIDDQRETALCERHGPGES